MISVLLLSLLGASPPSGPDVGAAIRELRRGFIEDGADRVAATPTHRVVSRPDGSLELQGAQSLRISVESVRRSRGSSCLAAPLAREVVPGSARTIRTRRACALEETWTNEAAGLEHAFILARPPKGTGGVVLRLGVEGPWHHQDAQGHVFKGPGAADLLRYGNAFVLRDGRRLPVPVVHVGGGLELRVPRELVEAPGAFPMFIDPILSMEQALDPTLIRGPSPAQEEMPAVAVNAGGTAMVVWVDNRRQLGTDLFGARFNSTGTLVDEAGFPVATGPGHQIRPAICAQAMEFLVAWEQPGDGGQEVMACAVSSSGVPTAPQPVAMGSQPSLAAPGDAGYSLLAWVDRSSAVQVVQMRGRMAGTPYVRPPETGGATSSNPVIAASNRSWFVAWESRLGIATPIIRGMGDGLIPSALVALSNADFVGSGRPTVALGSTSNDDEAFIFWEHGPNIAGLRLTTGGPIPYPEFLGSRPSAVRTSLVQGAQPILGSLLGNSLQLRDLNLGDGGFHSFGIGGQAGELALAATGTRLYATWTASPQGSRDVWGAMVAVPLGMNTANTTPVRMSPSAGQFMPHVAMRDDAPEGLAVWVDPTNSLRATRVTTQNGVVTFNSPPFTVASPATDIESIDVAAGTTGTYLVTWRQKGSNVGHLATSSGKTGGPLVFSVLSTLAGPVVAWDEQNSVYVVAWGQLPLGGGVEVLSRTVEINGLVSQPVVRASEVPTELDLTCFGGKCLLAWELAVSRDIRGMVFGALAAPPFTLSQGSQPAVAHDGRTFFLGWRGPSGLLFAEVPFDGSPPAAPQVGQPIRPNVLFGPLSLAPGDPPVASWAEVSPGDEWGVYLQRLDFRDPALFVAGGSNPIVATSGVQRDAEGVVVYQRYVSGSLVNSMRAFGKTFVLPEPQDAGVDGRDGGADSGVDPGADGGLEGGDGGVMTFETSGCGGCQSASAAPLLLLALMAFRRRR